MAFHEWVENEYNSKRHGGLGMAPLDRFHIDRERVEFLEPSETSEELFFLEKTAKVGKDNTFRFASKRWETPVELSSKEITLRFHRIHKDPVIIYYKGERLGQAREVDLVANSSEEEKGEDHDSLPLRAF